MWESLTFSRPPLTVRRTNVSMTWSERDHRELRSP